MDILFPNRKQKLASPRTRRFFLASVAGLALAIMYRQPQNAVYVVGGAALATVTVLLMRLADSKKSTLVALSPEEWREFPLLQKTQVSPNTAIYRFGLPTPNHIMGLPVGQHISLRATLDLPDGTKKEVQRSYTPISSDKEPGYIDLLVKTYAAGMISKHLSLLDVSSHIQMRGPKGQFRYSPNKYNFMLLLAGGTGITPMYQVLRHVVEYNLERAEGAPADNTRIALVFANVNEEDILLRDEIDALCNKSNGMATVHYVLNNPPNEWKGSVGFVTKQIIESQLPQDVLRVPVEERAALKDVKILLCGPPPMIKAMTGYTDELGFQKPNAISKADDQVFKF
ncbi:NADH-cytochrome b5 reductase [Sorochytrium milnesiophthora]